MKVVNARKPIPHVEQAVTCTSRSSLVVSFLESQTVTVAQMHFVAQPHYSFERWDGKMANSDSYITGFPDAKVQTSYTFKRHSLESVSCSWLESVWPSQKAEAKNVSAKICELRKPKMVEELLLSSQTRNVPKTSATSLYLVCHRFYVLARWNTSLTDI